MGSYYGFPDITGFYDMLYGTAGVDLQSITCLFFGTAAAIVGDGNPPFTINNFLGIYPKFFGVPTPLADLAVTENSAVVTGFTADTIQGLAIGQLVTNASGNFPSGTLISSINVNTLTVTMNNAAIGNDTTMIIYASPVMPLLVIMTYLVLANASVKFGRYQAAWFMQMCYFIAHYSTLYMRTESGVPNITAAQIAVSGLTKGIVVARAAGDVSAKSELLLTAGIYEEFGAWGETQYGEIFITVAAATAAGGIWLR